MINMVWISIKQKKTMRIINAIVKEFGKDKWFIQKELPDVTAHTMDALVSKGYLETMITEINDIKYYRRIKEM